MTTASTAASAQSSVDKAIIVTPDNFVRAESDTYFAQNVKRTPIGTFDINREVMTIDHQKVVRANRDTLYSTGVFDLDAALVTVTLPDPGRRFMSMQVITEDHYTPTYRALSSAGSRTGRTRGRTLDPGGAAIPSIC